MDLRAKLAMFGHMGIEADPRAMSEGERATLAAVVALYKQWRPVLHAGHEREIERGDGGFGRLAMADDLSRGLAIVGQLVSPLGYNAPPVRLTGLPPDRRYRVTLPEPWGRGRAMLPDAEAWRQGRVLSGRALADGIVLPLQAPETAWLIALEAVDG
jgi:alpha-galactosidase